MNRITDYDAIYDFSAYQWLGFHVEAPDEERDHVLDLLRNDILKRGLSITVDLTGRESKEGRGQELARQVDRQADVVLCDLLEEQIAKVSEYIEVLMEVRRAGQVDSVRCYVDMDYAYMEYAGLAYLYLTCLNGLKEAAKEKEEREGEQDE